jgi:hypothetical protein
MGCFTRRPTVTATHAGRLETCERCGRILYRPEEPEPPASAPSAPLPRKKRGGRGRG